MFVGPNGVGKTKISYMLARRHGGEIVNLDRTYLYKHFPITTGMQDALKEEGVPRHLYELLEPEETSFTSSEFLQLVYAKLHEINSRNSMAIVEGASTIYGPALLEQNSKEKIFDFVIGLRFPDNYDVESKYRLRIDQALKEGLVEEILKNRYMYQNSFLIKDCHFGVPIFKYLNDEMNLNQAKEEILQRCLHYKDQQVKFLSRYSEINWIEASEFKVAYQKVEKILKQE